MMDHLYIQRKVSRRASRSADFAPGFALLGIFLLAAGLLAHRFGLIEQPDLVLIATVAVFLAALALLLAAKCFYNLWRSGDQGGRRGLRAVMLALATLALPAYLAGQLLVSPRIHDISTDLEEPVLFNTVMANSHPALLAEQGQNGFKILQHLGLGDLVASNSLGADEPSDKLQQLAAYPEVSGRQYDSAPDHILKAVLKVMKDQGLVVTGISGAAGTDRVVSVEAEAKTTLLGLRSDLVVQLRDETEQTTVDMRAVSHYGRNDLGINAGLITDFFSALDLEMHNGVPDAPQS